ncbi:hypothetical protein AYJ57_20600 (plasmid) [Salipiger sp. CCB-MM3]|uniref:DUF2939 domain-containing protein n=1 Tax=Salipiger sp. CCB-MM3 TaxID=1792508 RepID=UPI00080AAF3C|nr:DUF2939 domain-containing protein [Salipiger sp. CCB-MM3]ANT62888.1 hypothetical protein AYJ57_20600 [Salipiger sp. CCB-MM3]
MKKYIAAGALALVALSAHVFASPLIAASSLKSAIDNQDADALVAKIDFDALHENVRSEIDDIVAAEQNPMAREMTKAILNDMLDNFASEQAVTSWANSGMGARPDTGDMDYSFGFGVTRFKINLETEAGPVSLVMAPRGLTWKVVGVEFDPAALGMV